MQQESVQILDSGVVKTMSNRADLFTCDVKGPIDMSNFVSGCL